MIAFWFGKGPKMLWSCFFFRYLTCFGGFTRLNAFLGNKESLVHESKCSCRIKAFRMSSTLLESLSGAQSCYERCDKGRGVVVVL